MFVTAQTQEYIDLSREVGDALASLGLDVREVDGILTVDGARVALNLVARAHPTPADLRQLAGSSTGHLPAVVVADRISEPLIRVLRSGEGNPAASTRSARAHSRPLPPSRRAA